MSVTVVVGVDYSEASKEALRLAAQEARWRQAPLIAVSAYEPPIGPVGGFPGSAMHTEGEQRATAEAELRATVDEQLHDQAVQTELRVSAGLAGRVIVETARQTHAQLVVLAARDGHGRGAGNGQPVRPAQIPLPVTIVPHDGKDEETDNNYP